MMNGQVNRRLYPSLTPLYTVVWNHRLSTVSCLEERTLCRPVRPPTSPKKRGVVTVVTTQIITARDEQSRSVSGVCVYVCVCVCVCVYV